MEVLKKTSKFKIEMNDKNEIFITFSNRLKIKIDDDCLITGFSEIIPKSVKGKPGIILKRK